MLVIGQHALKDVFLCLKLKLKFQMVDPIVLIQMDRLVSVKQEWIYVLQKVINVFSCQLFCSALITGIPPTFELILFDRLDMMKHPCFRVCRESIYLNNWM